MGLNRATAYRPLVDWAWRDAPVIAALTTLVAAKNLWGFWKCCDRLRLDGSEERLYISPLYSQSRNVRGERHRHTSYPRHDHETAKKQEPERDLTKNQAAQTFFLNVLARRIANYSELCVIYKPAVAHC